MRLTPNLVARVAEQVEECSPAPTEFAPSDADYERWVQEILAGAPQEHYVWVFAYGSLIWNPAFEFVEQRVGTAHGWHRSFCLGPDHWFRGSKSRPGLMLSIDRGGQCTGLVFRLPPDDVEPNLQRLVRRERRMKRAEGPAHIPRWVNVRSETGSVKAIAFVINRNSDLYVCDLSPEQVADRLAVAVGPVGSMAEYLYSTVRHLEELGIHDRQLWRLQELVAERIEARTGVGRAADIAT